MERMWAVVKEKPERGFTVREVSAPIPGADEILVKVLASSICGTDVHIYRWDSWSQNHIHLPRIIGHEMAGEVVEAGRNVSRVKTGDYISVETHFADWTCFMCRTGNPHLCQNLKTLGIDVDGSYAEYVAIPAVNAWKNDRTLPPEVASIQEPMGNAVYATLVEDVAGKTVAVFGAGPIGLMCCAVAKASGATKIFLVEPHPARLSLGQKMGATHLINPKTDDTVTLILDETHGIGVDVLLEMSGAPKAFEQGFQVLRNGGRASLLGIPSTPIRLDFSEAIILKGAKVYGIHGRKMFETWYKVSELLTSGKVDVSPIITQRMKLAEVVKAMELLMNQEATKIVLFPT